MGSECCRFTRSRSSKAILERFITVREQIDLDVLWDEIMAKDIRVMTWEYALSRLREISQPPPSNYLRGDFVEEDALAVIIAGSRWVTPCEWQVTEEVASSLVF